MSTMQWANIGEDAGALHALLERIPEHVAIAAIDYLWIFPARRIAIGESIVIVVGAFDEDPARRRVSTAHFTIARNKKGVPSVNVRFTEHGSAPGTAVPRIVEGVLRRLGEDTDAAPRQEEIGGEQDRWNEMLVELGGRTPAPAGPQEPAAPDEPAAAEPAAGPLAAETAPYDAAPAEPDAGPPAHEAASSHESDEPGDAAGADEPADAGGRLD
jgi:hypothetical protein